jgi:hypothetical protein
LVPPSRTNQRKDLNRTQMDACAASHPQIVFQGLDPECVLRLLHDSDLSRVAEP